MGVSAIGRDARRTLAKTSLTPGWVVVAAALVVGLAGVTRELPVSLRYLPLLLSTLFLGIPHGAIDHLTLSRARGEAVTLRTLAAVGLCYLLLGGAYAVGWLVFPAASFVFFLLLTWAHWGQGDVYPFVALAEETHLDDRTGRALTAAVRGGLPMVVPLVGSPGQYHAVATSVVRLFDPASTSLAWLLRIDVRWALGGGLALLTVGTLVRGYGRGDGRSWRVDAAETGLLWGYFLAVPPVLAIGLYFPLWHSLRHIGRLVALDPGARAALTSGDGWRGLRRFARDALPLTVVSVALLAGVAVAVPAGVGTVPEAAAAYLVLLAVLTLPHVVVVTALDRIQGVW